MEEMRKRNKSVHKVQPIFQTKTHCESFAQLHARGTFSLLTLHLWQTAGCLLNLAVAKLTDFHTNMSQVILARLQHIDSGSQLFPVEQRVKFGSNLLCWVMLLLGAPFWYPLVLAGNRQCQAPVSYGGGRIDNH